MPGLLGRLFRGQSETTPVSSETEVVIPWQTYVRDSLRASIFVLGAWAIGWLVWASRATETVSFLYWGERQWWPWMQRRWYWVVISLILCWIGLSNWAYSYRLKIEQIIKNPPLYGEWNPMFGWWHPFKRVQQAPKMSLSLRLKDLLDMVGLEIVEEDEEEGEDTE